MTEGGRQPEKRAAAMATIDAAMAVLQDEDTMMLLPQDYLWPLVEHHIPAALAMSIKYARVRTEQSYSKQKKDAKGR